MKLLEKVVEIIDKYNLKPIQISNEYSNIYTYLSIYPEKQVEYTTDVTDTFLLDKYKNNIPEGWYGFAIGTPIIPSWPKIIDEVLQLCITNDPNFEIHQIKLKFGGICFYVHSEIIEDIFDIESVIEDRLYDKLLIY